MTLAQAFAHQATSCTQLGSPFMGQLFSVLSTHWPHDSRLGARFASFTGDIGASGASLPLRIAGGLHALVLAGRAPDLARLYPPDTVSDAALRHAVLTALTAQEDFLLDWVENAPQTNEVRRSGALIPGASVVAQHFDLPIWLSELGASGGLNLMWDRFALDVPGIHYEAIDPVLTLSPQWKGPPPPAFAPRIAARAGVDLNPLDPRAPDDLLRLTAYLWPDQPERLALTRAAASVMDAQIVQGDAIAWLRTRLHDAPEGHTHLIQHSVAWQYFPPDTRALGRAMIEEAGAKASPTRPLAWHSFESDGDTTGALGAALTLRLWPGDLTLDLGRADFHGRWVTWRGPS